MKRIFSFVIILLFFLANISTAAAQSLDINAISYILIDSKSGQVLYEYNSNKQGVYPASTTKIMTAILALEKGNLDQMMTASQAAIYDIGKDGMNIGIMPGEQMSMENLLNAVLISSANEAANIIAENICSTRQEFVDLMNEKARELGAVKTHFVNPCGMHDDNHYTTASDLAKIARYAMSLPKYREIVKKTEYTLPPTNKHQSWPTLYTTNRLLRSKSNGLFEVNGIKTGYTGPAGQNVVASAVNEEGMELISVVLGVKEITNEKNAFTYSNILLEYGFKNFSLQKLVDANQIIANVPVEGAEEDTLLSLVADNEIKAVLPADSSSWNLSKKEYIKSPITAPVNQGDVLGYIEYEKDGVSLGKVNIVASRSVEMAPQAKLLDTAERTAQNPLFKQVVTIVAIILVLFIALRFTLRRISRQKRRRKYRYYDRHYK